MVVFDMLSPLESGQPLEKPLSEQKNEPRMVHVTCGSCREFVQLPADTKICPKCGMDATAILH